MQAKTKPLPHLWLFTDERLTDDALLTAANALPKGSGVVFRHYSLPRSARRALLDAVRVIARRRRLMMLVAGPWPGGPISGVAGRHRPQWISPRKAHTNVAGKGLTSGSNPNRKTGTTHILSMPVHSIRDAITAKRAGADMVFISPVFPTRSHPNAPTLGIYGFARIRRMADTTAIALGGMNAPRYRRIKPMGADGWAGIDALQAGG